MMRNNLNGLYKEAMFSVRRIGLKHVRDQWEDFDGILEERWATLESPLPVRRKHTSIVNGRNLHVGCRSLARWISPSNVFTFISCVPSIGGIRHTASSTSSTSSIISPDLPPLTILTSLPPGRDEVESLGLGTTTESPLGVCEGLVDSFDFLLSIVEDASWL